MMSLTGALGTYTLGIQAKDINDAESEWAYAHINVTKDKAINNPFQKVLQNFFESHPNIFLLMQKLLIFIK